MVGGAHGVVGHHVLQHMVIVRRPGNVFVTTPLPQVVEVIVSVAAASKKIVTLQVDLCY